MPAAQRRVGLGCWKCCCVLLLLLLLLQALSAKASRALQTGLL